MSSRREQAGVDLNLGNIAAIGLEQAFLEPFSGLHAQASRSFGWNFGLRNESFAGPSPPRPMDQGP